MNLHVITCDSKRFHAIATAAFHGFRDHLMAHEFTKYKRLPSPFPGSVSALPPGKLLDLPRMWYGIVPVSPALTRGSLPKIDDIGMTYNRGRLGSSSYRRRVSAFLIQSPAAASSSGQSYSSSVEMSTHFILYLAPPSPRTTKENTSKHCPYHTLSGSGRNVSRSAPSGSKITGSWRL